MYSPPYQILILGLAREECTYTLRIFSYREEIIYFNEKDTNAGPGDCKHQNMQQEIPIRKKIKCEKYFEHFICNSYNRVKFGAFNLTNFERHGAF